MKDYPWPAELALFCYRVAKKKGWCLDKALQLLAWNTVIQRWSKPRTLKAAGMIISMWRYDDKTTITKPTRLFTSILRGR